MGSSRGPGWRLAESTTRPGQAARCGEMTLLARIARVCAGQARAEVVTPSLIHRSSLLAESTLPPTAWKEETHVSYPLSVSVIGSCSTPGGPAYEQASKARGRRSRALLHGRLPQQRAALAPIGAGAGEEGRGAPHPDLTGHGCDTSAFLAVYETYGLLSLTDPPSAEAIMEPKPVIAAGPGLDPCWRPGEKCISLCMRAVHPATRVGCYAACISAYAACRAAFLGRGGGRPIGGIKPTLDSVSPGAFPPVSGR